MLTRIIRLQIYIKFFLHPLQNMVKNLSLIYYLHNRRSAGDDIDAASGQRDFGAVGRCYALIDWRAEDVIDF